MTTKSKIQYANVAPAMPLPAAGRQVFTYKLPAGHDIAPRQLVQVSVGRRYISGVIINTHSQKPSYPTKTVKRLYGAALTPSQVELAQWITRLAHGSLGYTARLFFPPSLPSGKPLSSQGKSPLPPGRERGGGEGDNNISSNEKSESYKLPAISCLTAPFQKRLPHLVEQLQANLKNNQQTLILVPEIWMIDQLISELSQQKTLKKHLLPYYGGLKNSDLTKTWNAIGQSQPVIVIGTQKALFLPWQNIAHVIIEEEAFDTHKLWDQYPRLDNRLAARQLAHIHQAQLTLANTYPSLATEYLRRNSPPPSEGELAAEGEPRQRREGVSKSKSYKLKADSLKLKPRLTSFSHQDRRSRRLLPHEFLPRLRTWYKSGDQILFLYNRRQEAELSTKPGWQTDITTVADILKKLRFPQKKILWLDAPAVAKKSPTALAKQIQDARIIIATSVIFTHLQGHQIGRVAWLFPEQTINYPDYRSVERARIILSRLQQVTLPRRSVDLLSRQPRLVEEHLLTDHQAWTKRELNLRRRYHYPPSTDIVRLTSQGKTQKEADAKANKLRQQLEKQKENLSPSTEGEQAAEGEPRQRREGVSKILIRGPYRSLAKLKNREKRESHLLLQGPLEHLVNLYHQANPDQADPYPHQIL